MSNPSPLARPFAFYVATLLFFGVGCITTIGLNWYAGLTLPSWAPPNLAAAAAWFVLFFTTATSAVAYWNRAPHTGRIFGWVLALYVVNSFLVLLWDYLFFGVHKLGAAFGVAALVGATVIGLMTLLWKDERKPAVLLAPYLLWMVFALIFTYEVMVLNP